MVHSDNNNYYSQTTIIPYNKICRKLAYRKESLALNSQLNLTNIYIRMVILITIMIWHAQKNVENSSPV